ncbi:MAG TPA: hypothetical protein H9815_12335 [Candidatus Ruania gallistercoris]|uniref:Uncharacterized protein n=1 Tax=Candidatus Ruania gallistercoris TaxID=2838746 RepID=A0A9D2EFM5_9MICO|nr:hypothetical protein [Candidatus Ruania gallistercoris]
MTDQRTGERRVGVNEGSRAWAEEAVAVLTEVASHYQGVITYAELAEEVQTRTRLRTGSPLRNWIGGVLATVVARCHAEGLPPLTSLVVHGRGKEGGTEDSTAAARFTCYRRFADDIPAEVLAAVVAAEQAEAEAAADAARERRSRPATRSAQPRERRRPVPEEAPKVCPSCFMQLPASGICDDCG